jgi:hypothetical protein
MIQKYEKMSALTHSSLIRSRIFDNHGRNYCSKSRKGRNVTGMTGKTLAVHAASPTIHCESILKRARKLSDTEYVLVLPLYREE